MKHTLLLICFASSFLMSVNSARADTCPITITAAPWQPIMSVEGPVAIDLEVINTTSKRKTLQLGDDQKEAIGITATASNGVKYKSHAWKPREGLAQYGLVTIVPGGTVRLQLILQDWKLELSPGTYDVSINFGKESGSDNEECTPEVHARVELVGKDNVLAVKETCSSASKEYLAATSAVEAQKAANLLAVFHTEAALDCLSNAYNAHSLFPFQYLLINAIGAIGTNKARDFLSVIVRGSNGEDAQIAASELEKK